MVQCGIYEHYSGRKYQVFGVARHTETKEEMVIYQALYDNYGFWTRPLKMFIKTVLREGQPVPRFRFIQTSLKCSPM